MRRSRTGSRGAAGPVAAAWVAVALLAAGCGVLPPLPDPVPSDIVAAPSAPVSPGTGNLSPDGFDVAVRIAVRIRNVGCDSLSTGSGFAIDDHTLVTNSHVVADSAELQLSTYDGRDLSVTASQTAGVADLALVRTADPLPAAPVLASGDPRVGDEVSVVGFPGGGELTVTSGRVIAITPDPLDLTLGDVLVTDAVVQPGSSGSPVLGADGSVVGVVYAKDAADHAYAIPVSMLRALLADDAGFAAAATVCE